MINVNEGTIIFDIKLTKDEYFELYPIKNTDIIMLIRSINTNIISLILRGITDFFINGIKKDNDIPCKDIIKLSISLVI